MAMNFALSKNGSRGRRAGRCSTTASFGEAVSPAGDAPAGIPVGAAGGAVGGVLGEVIDSREKSGESGPGGPRAANDHTYTVPRSDARSKNSRKRLSASLRLADVVGRVDRVGGLGDRHRLRALQPFPVGAEDEVHHT